MSYYEVLCQFYVAAYEEAVSGLSGIEHLKFCIKCYFFPKKPGEPFKVSGTESGKLPLQAED